MLLFICVSLTYIFPFVFLLCLSIFVFSLKCYCSFVFLIFLWFVFLLPICLCIFVFYMCSICVWKYKLNYGQPVRTNQAPCSVRNVMLQSVMKWVKLNFKIHIQYLLDLGARLDSKWANGGDLCAPHSVTVLPFSSILYRWKVEFSGTQHDEGPTLMAHKQGLELTQIIWVCSDISSFF